MNERLNILLTSKVIDEDTFNFVTNAKKFLIDKKLINENNNADMLLTHLAIAHMRQKKGEPVVVMDEVMENELALHIKIDLAHKLVAELLELTEISFHKTEINLICLHIITLLEGI